jgi:hypothetical protein
VLVYPIRWMTWASATICATFIGGTAAALIYATTGTAVVVLLWIGLVTSILGAFPIIRQLRDPRPALRLDAHGAEGAFGKLAWGNVRSISIEPRWDSTYVWAKPVVVFHLAHGIRPTPSEGKWASDLMFRTKTTASEIRLRLWRRRSTVEHDVSQFYRGPIH